MQEKMRNPDNMGAMSAAEREDLQHIAAKFGNNESQVTPIKPMPKMPIRQQLLQDAIEATSTERNALYGDPVAVNTAFGKMLAVLISNREPRCSDEEFGALVLAQFRLLQAAMAPRYNKDTTIEALSFLALASESARENK